MFRIAYPYHVTLWCQTSRLHCVFYCVIDRTSRFHKVQPDDFLLYLIHIEPVDSHCTDILSWLMRAFTLNCYFDSLNYWTLLLHAFPVTMMYKLRNVLPHIEVSSRLTKYALNKPLNTLNLSIILQIYISNCRRSLKWNRMHIKFMPILDWIRECAKNSGSIQHTALLNSVWQEK